jgi:Holliday junction resolvase RusA-like endonuclease
VLSLRKHIIGVPYSQSKPRGDRQAPDAWSQAVIEQTKDLPLVKGPCLLRVTFLLPPDKFPSDHPYGSDLDNLLKRFCDALVQTIFREAPGGDGCILSMEVTKTKVDSREAAGAVLEIVTWPVA